MDRLVTFSPVALSALICLSSILCVKSGNPITIADEDIGTLLPTALVSYPDFEYQMFVFDTSQPNLELDDSPAVVLAHYTQLSRILGKIMEGACTGGTCISAPLIVKGYIGKAARQARISLLQYRISWTSSPLGSATFHKDCGSTSIGSKTFLESQCLSSCITTNAST